MEFTRMQGVDNDYVYVDCFRETVRDPTKITIYMSDRHFGVGSDRLILIRPPRTAGHRIEIYNADGPQGIMCSNGVCCVGKYVYDHGPVDKNKRIITVEIPAGTKTLELEIEDGRAVSVTVDMGKVASISRLSEDITVDGERHRFMGINMGNLHAVYYVGQVDSPDLERIGPAFENHARFVPGRVNTGFIHVVDRKHLDMRVWERGSGETWARDIRATVSVVAFILVGYTEDEAEVALRGGKLVIRYDRESGRLFMTGSVVGVFRDSINVPGKIHYD